MIWSSSRPQRRAGVTEENGAAEAWGWDDLEQSRPELSSYDGDDRMREVEEAYNRGFTDGQEAGAASARDELEVAMRTTLEALEEVRANREAWNARLEERVALLAAGVAQWVIQRTCEEDPTLFVELAERAVAAFPVEEAVRIRLHPSDQQTLTDPALMDRVVGERAVKWIPDEDVVPGGCIVEGPDKIVDGRIDEALVRIVRSLSNG